MSGSFAKIDYQLRPAKAVERKMMAEIFSRLAVFAPLSEYRYVGMGSVYFSDFALFHSVCGFGDMVSIEGTEDTRIKRRCAFNAPFGVVDLHFEKTTTAFLKIDWTKRSVIWLDYDDPLSQDMLSDLAYLASRVTSGSVISLSFNAARGQVRTSEQLVEKLRESVGPDKIPDDATLEDHVDQRRYSRVLRSVVSAEFNRAIGNRNADGPPEEKISSQQIFFYTYDDDTPMLTVGWLLTAPTDEGKAKLSRIPEVLHASSGVRPFEIVIPKLTPAEMRAISRCDATDKYEKERSLPLLKEEIAKFKKIERYWPMARFLELG